MGPRGTAWDGVGWRGTAWDGVGPAGTRGDGGPRGRDGGPAATALASRGGVTWLRLNLRGDFQHLNSMSHYRSVLQVILHHMDTSTSSKGEGEPDFHSSKVV